MEYKLEAIDKIKKLLHYQLAVNRSCLNCKHSVSDELSRTCYVLIKQDYASPLSFFVKDDPVCRKHQFEGE